jgi:hypothetical protein
MHESSQNAEIRLTVGKQLRDRMFSVKGLLNNTASAAPLRHPSSTLSRVSGIANMAAAVIRLVMVTYQAGEVGSPVTPMR